MAFYDDLARDPTSKEEFWTIIGETFVLVEGSLTDYPVETREEALAGTLRGGNFKDASLSFIGHCGVRDDLDSRDYFLEMGRQFLPDVERQIKARKLTPKFAKDWGVVMMCHGSLDASYARSSFDNGEAREKVTRGRQWEGVSGISCRGRW